ncbi:hypothetical protein NDU88_002430 [Pleurodeles waltl]|uniref:Uncharacterized protein n=1 Tax=Pleurodeles waltl TaxID=8319 RepID=A0AAV7SDN4_PLEWA|nr:hypothetical protein NDU88_002430 [Pleurodeles waltl]
MDLVRGPGVHRFLLGSTFTHGALGHGLYGKAESLSSEKLSYCFDNAVASAMYTHVSRQKDMLTRQA